MCDKGIISSKYASRINQKEVFFITCTTLNVSSDVYFSQTYKYYIKGAGPVRLLQIFSNFFLNLISEERLYFSYPSWIFQLKNLLLGRYKQNYE